MRCCMVLLLLLISRLSMAQVPVDHLQYFKDFFDDHDGKCLLIVGENHASSVGPSVYPKLVKYLHRHNGVKKLLIEFGPSEAYFYNRFLTTGDKKYLRYTIYGGYYKDWQAAWQKIYDLNKQLKTPLKVIGIDFDRARTLGYALYNMWKAYPSKPRYVDSLMQVIRTEAFYKNYTNGYQTEKDKQFTGRVRDILKQHERSLAKWMSPGDLEVIRQVIQNTIQGFNGGAGNREAGLALNTAEMIGQSKDSNFLMLVGRDHAYYKDIYGRGVNLASLLREKEALHVCSGVILFENSKLWKKDYKETVTLFEVKNKIPWKGCSREILKRIKGDITIVPLDRELASLSAYTDYLIIACDQPPIAF